MGVQCCRNVGGVVVRILILTITSPATIYSFHPSQNFYNIGHLSQQDRDWLPDYGISECRNMSENIEYQWTEEFMHFLLVFHSHYPNTFRASTVDSIKLTILPTPQWAELALHVSHPPAWCGDYEQCQPYKFTFTQRGKFPERRCGKLSVSR
jgi:hypothetical protein